MSIRSRVCLAVLAQFGAVLAQIGVGACSIVERHIIVVIAQLPMAAHFAPAVTREVVH